jgi:hypothetical protein
MTIRPIPKVHCRSYGDGPLHDASALYCGGGLDQ